MNGKGSRPRNCFSKSFRDNYEKINWGCRRCGGTGTVLEFDWATKKKRKHNGKMGYQVNLVNQNCPKCKPLR